jgi:hypothetical protein
MWYVYLDRPSVYAHDMLTITQVGWTVPFLWAAVWAAITTKWVQKSLAYEYKMWTEDRAKAQTTV